MSIRAGMLVDTLFGNSLAGGAGLNAVGLSPGDHPMSQRPCGVVMEL